MLPSAHLYRYRIGISTNQHVLHVKAGLCYIQVPGGTGQVPNFFVFKCCKRLPVSTWEALVFDTGKEGMVAGKFFQTVR